jgi:putative aldouronate transport system permease protein
MEQKKWRTSKTIRASGFERRKMPGKGITLKIGDKRVGLLKVLHDQRYLLWMCVPFVIWLVIFRYIPLWGWTMGFQEFKPGQPTVWVGLSQFFKLFTDERFYFALRNTMAMSVLNLVFGTITAIVFAFFLNEVRVGPFKRTVQTVSYLPYFVSWVIVASIFTRLLAPTGPINEALVGFNIVKKPVAFLGDKDSFWYILTGINIWKNMGWNAIVYLAAIAGINPELYEAAKIDGAGRFAQMRHITLPGIISTVVVILIMNIGWLINIGFESQYLFMNQLNIESAEVLDLYVINYGIGLSRYSYGTAIGIFKSVVSVGLVMVANRLAKRAGVTYIF